MSGPTYKEMFAHEYFWVDPNASRERFSTFAREKLHDGQESLTAVGLLSGFTGKGADILIIDDPYASPDDARSRAINERVWRWWNELAKVRLNDQTHVIVMFHRYHEDDFAGRLLAQGGWEYIRFPAIADQNEDNSDPTGRPIGQLLSPIRSIELLNEIEDRDPHTWLSQFQGRPRPYEGMLMKREWLQELSPMNLPNLNLWVRFWDLATKAEQTGDYVAGALVGVGPGQCMIVRDIVRFRAEWPDARDIIAETTRRDLAECKSAGAQYEVGLEHVAWMRPMIQDLFLLPIFKSVRLTPVKPNGDKKERASGWIARAKNRMFYLVKGHWNSEFISECLAFDGFGKAHDDQVDAVSGAYQLLWDLKGGLTEPKPVPEVGSYRYWKDLAAANRRRNDW